MVNIAIKILAAIMTKHMDPDPAEKFIVEHKKCPG